METISKPALARLAVVLPTSVKALLRCGEVTVYDLLELAFGTLNKTVVTNDENAAKLEDWGEGIAEWSNDLDEALDVWKSKTLKDIGEAIEAGVGPITFILKDGDVLWSHLSTEVKKKITESTGTKVLAVYLDKLGQMHIMDDSEKEEGEDPETIVTVGAPFAKNLFDGTIVGELVSAPTDGIDWDKKAGLMTAQDYIDLQIVKNRKLNNIPTASASTLGGVKIGDGISIKDGAISTSIEKLGIRFDHENGLMIVGDKTYKLTEVADVPVYTEEWGEPVITGINYNKINANGYVFDNLGNKIGIAPNYVTYSQKKITYKDGIVEKEEVFFGDLNTEEAEFEFKNVGTFTVDNSNGRVITGPSKLLTESTLGNVYAYVTVNGRTSGQPNVLGAIVQQPATMVMSRTPSEFVFDENGGSGVITMNYTDGVEISSVTTNVDWATALYVNSTKKIIVNVQPNTLNEDRTFTVSIVTNIFGTKTETGTQNKSTQPEIAYAFAGTSANDVPTDLTGTTKYALTTDVVPCVCKIASAEKKKVYFVAVPADSGYSIADGSTLMKAYDKDTDDLSALVKESASAIAGYVVYYIKSDVYENNTVTFNIVD